MFGFLRVSIILGASAISTFLCLQNIVWFGDTYRSLFCSTCWDLASLCWRGTFHTDLQQKEVEDKLHGFQWLNQFMAVRVNPR